MMERVNRRSVVAVGLICILGSLAAYRRLQVQSPALFDFGVRECPVTSSIIRQSFESSMCNHRAGGMCILELHCKEGERLVGALRVSCLGNGTWSPEPARCEPIQCAGPKLVGNVTADRCGSLVGDTCGPFRCTIPQAMLVGAESLTCTAAGNWSALPPVCILDQHADCPPFQLDAQISVRQPCQTKSGSMCGPFQCPKGLRLVGDTHVTCLDGKWTNTSPSCSTDVLWDRTTTWENRWVDNKYYKSAGTDVLFHSTAKSTLRRKLIFGSQVWWLDGMPNYCPNSQCQFAQPGDEVDIPVSDLWHWNNRDPLKAYVVVCHEPGHLLKDPIDAGIPQTQWGATFRWDSDFPTTFNEWNYGRPQTIPIQQAIDFLLRPVPIAQKNQWRKEGTGLVVFVSSNCNTPSKREIFAKELMTMVKVDSYGKCLHNKDYVTVNDVPEFAAIEELNMKYRYKFCIAFSSIIEPDYISEKFFRAVHAGCVPIVNGPRSDYEKVWIGDNSVIFRDEYRTVKELADYLKYLDDNDDEYLKYFAWKEHGLSGQWMRSWEMSFLTVWCRLCDYFVDHFSGRVGVLGGEPLS